MEYSIYRNLNETDFLFIKEKLEIIERIISPIMQLSGFYLNRDGHYADYLGLDYICYDGFFNGNIGLQYCEDESLNDKKLFRFYILKSTEKEGILYYKKEELGRLYSVEEIQSNSIEFFKKCLIIYDSIAEEMIIRDNREKF